MRCTRSRARWASLWLALVLVLLAGGVRVQAAPSQVQASSVWTGTIHSESTWSASGCTEVWNINVCFIVAPDGTLAGAGTGDHVGLRGCQRPSSPQATHRVFDVKGHLGAGRFELQLNETAKDMVGAAYNGLLNYTLFAPSPWTLLARLVAHGRAEGTTTIEYTGPSSKATGVHSLRLREGLTEEQLRQAFTGAFQRRNLTVPPSFVAVQVKAPRFATYQIPLGKRYNILPSLEWVKEQFDKGLIGPQEAASFILLGSVQRDEERFRVLMRIVVVETGIVIDAGKGDGDGCSEGLDRAVDIALKELRTQIQPYAPHIPGGRP